MRSWSSDGKPKVWTSGSIFYMFPPFLPANGMKLSLPDLYASFSLAPDRGQRRGRCHCRRSPSHRHCRCIFIPPGTRRRRSGLRATVDGSARAARTARAGAAHGDLRSGMAGTPHPCNFAHSTIYRLMRNLQILGETPSILSLFCFGGHTQQGAPLSPFAQAFASQWVVAGKAMARNKYAPETPGSFFFFSKKK
jgi:hypothetical protein